MKQSVNLLSRDVLLGEPEVAFRVPWIPILAVALLAGLALWYGTERAHLKRSEARLHELQVQKQALDREAASLNGQIQALQGDRPGGIPILQQQLKVIDEQLKKRVHWSEVFRQISLLTPEGVYFTRLETVQSAAPAGGRADKKAVGDRVRFVGFAQSNVPVTAMIGALEQSEDFEDVSLVYLQRASGTGYSRMAFELTARLRPRGPGANRG